MTCASTRLRSEPKERREARFFAVIGFSHTDNVAIRAARCINDLNQTTSQQTKANNARLSIISACVLNLSGNALKYLHRIVKVQAPIRQSTYSFGRIVTNT